MPKQKSLEKKSEKQKVEERREEVLKTGRKFKYPLQYAKHRMVLFSIIVAILALVGLAGAGYYALYHGNYTSDVLYRLTSIIPVPIASIDGQSVRYSDYLLIYKSTITPVEQQGQLGSGADADAMRAHYQRSALTDAENYSYALKLAEEQGITVSDDEVTKSISDHRKIGGTERSEESFEKILEDNFGLSMDEYRRMVYLSLIKMKVSEKIDTTALSLANEVSERITADPDINLFDLANELGDQVLYEETGGLVDQMNVDGGRAAVAVTLEPGQISKRFVTTSGDGYCFVKLIEKTDSTVNYSSIKIPFKALDKKLESLRKEGKVQEYITLTDAS